jgi:hypothetical protein
METLHITAMSHVTPRCRLLHPLPLGYIRSLPSHQTQPWTHRITKKNNLPRAPKAGAPQEEGGAGSLSKTALIPGATCPVISFAHTAAKGAQRGKFRRGKSMRVGGRDRDANHQQGALRLGDEKGASEEGQTSTQPLNPRPLGGK